MRRLLLLVNGSVGTEGVKHEGEFYEVGDIPSSPQGDHIADILALGDGSGVQRAVLSGAPGENGAVVGDTVA